MPNFGDRRKTLEEPLPTRAAPTPVAGFSRSTLLTLGAVLLLHTVLFWAFFAFRASPPVLLVRMSSSVYSRAQVYWDVGLGMSESESSSVPVRPSAALRELRLPLPWGRIKSLRFDPLNCPGTIVIGEIAVLRSDAGTAFLFPPARIRGVLGFDQVEYGRSEVRYRVRSDSYDPQLILDLDSSLDVSSHNPGRVFLGQLLLVNALLIALEAPLVFRTHARRRFALLMRWLDTWAASAAARFSSADFVAFDRTAVWFYVTCVLLFLLLAAADINGSSMGVFWRNFKVGAPSRLLAGKPQEIRADEFNYETPDMLNQCFRERHFDLRESAAGGHGVALLASLPVRHVTTFARPQYWPFFLLPADYAFSAWWQAKWLIFATGVFTLLLLLTGSSALALTGTLWLFFSQFTQWCYTWPSMLPEMAGLFSFTVVLACYLTVGSHRVMLALAAVACAACAINFALLAYVPHLIPYAWAGACLLVAWCVAHRARVVRPEGRAGRVAAIAGCLFLAGLALLIIFHDTREAIQAIAATDYPGQRSVGGGGYSLTAFGTHFLAAFESDLRFPPQYSNICEASGFLWLAPVTLLLFGKMSALTRERRVLLAGLWAAALLLTGWMLLPIPASVGHLLFLDRVMALRILPALGLLNVAIVMVVLSSAHRPRRFGPGFGLAFRLLLSVTAAALLLSLANRGVDEYFLRSEVLLSALWAGALAAFVWDGRRALFGAAAVVPGVLLFGLINPLQRAIDPVTSSTLFELVHKDRRLLHGKWLVFPDKFPSSMFTAVGCDVYNGSKYLPDIDRFPLFAARGLDSNTLNNLGYVDIEELAAGQPPRVARSRYGVVIGLSPLDPLVKDLGIRYLAFHTRPSDAVRARLKPVADGIVSEFWLYEVQ